MSGPHPLPERLSAPAKRALAAAGISHLEQLAMMTRAEAKKLHGIGPLAMLQLDKALDSAGLRFKQ